MSERRGFDKLVVPQTIYRDRLAGTRIPEYVGGYIKEYILELEDALIRLDERIGLQQLNPETADVNMIVLFVGGGGTHVSGSYENVMQYLEENGHRVARYWPVGTAFEERHNRILTELNNGTRKIGDDMS